jgi:hypothetical protein
VNSRLGLGQRDLADNRNFLALNPRGYEDGSSEMTENSASRLARTCSTYRRTFSRIGYLVVIAVLVTVSLLGLPARLPAPRR